MKKTGWLGALSLLFSQCAFAEMPESPAFRQALDQAGLSSRQQIDVVPSGQGAPVLKVADFTPSNTDFLPEQYFKTHTVLTAHVWDNANGNNIPDVVYDRDGFTARFTDGAIKYQFAYVKVYKKDAFAILSLVETTHGSLDEQGAFTDTAETQSFTLPLGKTQIEKQTASSSIPGVDQGNGVLQFSQSGGATSVSTRQVDADRAENNSFSTSGLTTAVGDSMTLIGVDYTYRLDPVKQVEFLKPFPEKVQSFLKEFSRLHWTAVMAAQVLGDCLAKAGADPTGCSQLQADYDEAHDARQTYWSDTLEAKDLASLKPTRLAPSK